MKRLNAHLTRRRVVRLGDSDVVTHGLPRRFWPNAYHLFLTLPWPVFFTAIAGSFLLVNTVFAGLYMLGTAPVTNQSPAGFWGAFFFSVETLATVGYGDMHPATLYGHFVATVEIFAGMVNIALITGMVFARFSRPRALIMFADHPVVRPFNGRKTLMIRTGNARQNVILEATARLHLVRREISSEGSSMYRIHDLALMRDRQPMFRLIWSLMHVIDETSPLWGATRALLVEQDAGLILTLSGVDETTSQALQARCTYAPDAIRWDSEYRDMLHVDDEGMAHIDFHHFHTVQPLAQPSLPQANDDGPDS